MKDFFVGFWDYLKGWGTAILLSVIFIGIWMVVSLAVMIDAITGGKKEPLLNPKIIDGFQGMVNVLEDGRKRKLEAEIQKEETNEQL